VSWAGYVAQLGEKRMHIKFWWESQKEKDHMEGLVVGGRIILKLILER
jgi:hypothetical protein